MMEALDHKLALLLWGEDENGEDDVAIFAGVLISKDGEYFLQRDDGNKPEIREEWLDRIKPVSSDLKETLLQCDFQLSLSVGSIESNEGFESFAGLKWPNT